VNVLAELTGNVAVLALVNTGGAILKVASAAVEPLMGTLHAPVPVQAPVHPPKAEPAAGVAVSVTVELPAKAPMQMLPQSIPDGVDVMVPLPAPVRATVRRYCTENGVAVTGADGALSPASLVAVTEHA
jgi:hypothetical protein